jgi:hypothetical protein
MKARARSTTKPLTTNRQGLPYAHASWATLSPFTGHWTDCAAYDTNDEADCDCQ